MLFGEDYPKIEWTILDYHFLEPNTFIGDFLIMAVSLYFFYQLHKKYRQTPFNINWKYFYMAFAVSFLVGGLGHLLFHYFGAQGKYPGSFLAMLPPYFAEQAMISIYPNKAKHKLFKSLSNFKLILFVVLQIVMIQSFDMDAKPTLSTLVPALCSVVGLGTALGLLGAMYQKQIHPSFKYLWISALILLPSGLLQALKISFAQWFDRNDASHILLIISLFLYARTLKLFEEYQIKNAAKD